MPNENFKDPLKSFPVRFLPWLLGALMLVIYALTLNHWITLANLSSVARLTGQIWQPQIFGPLTWLATLPFHWLPAAKIPAALNLFSAVLAALVLVILARCVAILPQDRTEPQRQREKSDFSFLTGWQAWFPPVLAVLMFGLQLTFWKSATNFTGTMVALLVFAFIVWQLLEFRLDERDGRLALAAFALGAGMTEDWAFMTMAPLFIITVIWFKKLNFFNVRFLAQLVLCGLAGLLFFLLLPAMAKATADFKLGFWEALSPSIRLDWQALKGIKNGGVRIALAQAALTTMLPVLLMSLRWSASFGDNSRMGTALASNMFHVVQAAMFGACMWVMFDSPFCAEKLSMGLPMPFFGSPCLTLGFLSALGIGYAWGYFLLVFSRAPIPTKRNPRPLPIFPRSIMWVSPVIVVGTFVCAALMLAALVTKNKPVIASVNDATLLNFANLSKETLPKSGAIVLTDNDSPGQFLLPMRGSIVQSALERDGQAAQFPVLDTGSLNWAPYHKFVQKKHPGKLPLAIKDSKQDVVPPLDIFGMLTDAARSNTLCYLNPSYGYYFEQFYQEPHGLVYVMRTHSTNSLVPPPLEKNLIAENEAFWDKFNATLGPVVDKAIADSEIKQFDGRGTINWILMHLHAEPQVNDNAILVGLLASRSLNDWGVRLQQAGELDKAAKRFKDARRFNPENIPASVNLAFNQKLRDRSPMDLDFNKVTPDSFGKFRNWNAVVTANGPFDDLTFCIEAGFQFTQNGYFRQAAAQLERAHQLLPENLLIRFKLAQLYIFNHLPDRAMELLLEPAQQPANYGLNEANSTGLNVLLAATYFLKNNNTEGARLVETEIARHPDDDALSITAVQSFINRGLYTNALKLINTRLLRTPADPDWLFADGYVSMQVNDYAEAARAMTGVLEVQTNNVSARFNRALSNLQIGQLDAARADYLAVQSAYTTSYQVAYGLGEIAYRKKENAEALRQYQIYLANAPTNTPEANTVRARVKELGGK